MKKIKVLPLLLSTTILFSACGQANTTTTDKPVDEKTSQTEVVETTDDDKDDQTEALEANDDDKDDRNTAAMDDNGTPKEEDTLTNTTPEVNISMEDAIETFNSHFANHKPGIVSIELDHDDGFYKYDIEGQANGNEYQAKIDANTGEVIDSEIDDDDDDDKVIDFNGIINPVKAMEAALSGQDGAYVNEWELSYDDDRLVYDIDIENGSDKDVDALTGEVFDD